MKKLKKSLIIIGLLSFGLILLMNLQVFAKNNTILIKEVEYSEDFKKWLQLPEEEKKNVMQPRMYDVINTTSNISKNPLYRARMITASVYTNYNLKNIISTNLTIRNQQHTNSCWAFATLSSLETNIALSNLKNNINTSKVYDFSERHLEYATSKNFKNDAINQKGYNRSVGEGGNWTFAQSYLTNGTGAINEEEMEFEDNEDLIELSQIQNKTVTSQVYDTVEFENYNDASNNDRKTEIINQVKQHIQDYGAVYATIHGNTSSTLFSCYNNETAAKYCDDSSSHKADHAVSIVGWDDNYEVSKFKEDLQPNSPGAWIIRNSWGARAEYNLEELRNLLLKELQKKGYNQFTQPSQISDFIIQGLGYTIEGDKAYLEVGDDGFIYVSYEDCNISKTLYGIEKASYGINYENIYQYDDYYPISKINASSNSIMLSNVFQKKTKGKEYLTQVSIYAPEKYTCKVYVNPNGNSKAQNQLKLVELKTGTSEIINEGYHTLEFKKPVEITGEEFTVVVAIEGTSSSVKLSLESKRDGFEKWNLVKVETGKCFLAIGNDLSNCTWQDLGQLSSSSMGNNLSNGDSTIKAFTISKLYDDSLEKIEITKQPTKTNYFEGDNFQNDGMEVTAYYNREENPIVILDSSDYNISNGTNLTLGQESVTITYNDKSVEQSINVQANDVTELKITHEPNKKEYIEGQKFDSTGMEVQATYRNGTTKTIVDYTIENGESLTLEQKSVTITYESKSIEQIITVEPNVVTKLKITHEPNKKEYIEGQKFDSTGMEVQAIYKNGTTKTITEYTIENGENLTLGQKNVTITYNGNSVEQPITVQANSIVELKITHEPNKKEYKEGQTFDSAGMVVQAIYKNGTTRTITDYTIENGDNLNSNQTEVIISYSGKTVKQTIMVTPNQLVKIDVTKKPNKVNYIVGQDFDKTGMIVTGTYEAGNTREILDYIIENGTDLTLEQKSVTIRYGETTTIQEITVEEKKITDISIDKQPTKLKYIQNKENLNLTGGNLKVSYNDGTTENVSLTSNEVKVSGFSNKNIGKIAIIVTYKNKTTQFEVQIVEEEKAVNSNLEKSKVEIKKVQAYYFTNNIQDNYTLINAEIDGITRNTNNDAVEYYYYISSNPNDQNINNWTKITETQDDINKIQFIIDSRKVANYYEIASEEVVYLYIKETAIKGGNQSITISKSMKLETDKNIETFVDDVKKENLQTNDSDTNQSDKYGDNTVASGKLPQTGVSTTVFVLVMVMTCAGIILYIKYKTLSKYIK